MEAAQIMKNVDVLNIDGRLLSIFLSVLKTRSVSQTAQSFGVTQSTISHNLDKLRSCIGDPLFVKSGRGITPTQRAFQIEPIAQVIVAQIQSIKSPLEFDPERETRPFTIASNVTETLNELCSIRGVIDVLAPKAGVRFVELGSHANVGEVLADTSIDLAIGVRPRRYPPVLNHHSLYVDSTVVFFDPTARTRIRTLHDYIDARHGVLDFGGTAKSMVVKSLEKLGVKRKVHISASNSYALSRLIKGTNIIATMQSRLTNTVFSDFQFCLTPFEAARIEFDLIWHKRAEHTGRNIWLRKIVISAV